MKDLQGEMSRRSNGHDDAGNARARDAANPPRKGRPPHAPAIRRTRTITVRLSPTELAMLRKRAAEAGMRPIPYLREAALSGYLGSAARR